MKTSQQKNNSAKAFIVTVAIYAFLVGLCFIFHITATNPPYPEDAEGGIIVNYGTVDEGMGSDYMSSEEVNVTTSDAEEVVVQEHNISVEEPKVVTTPEPTLADVPKAEGQDEIITSDDSEEAIPVAKSKTKEEKKEEVAKPTTVATTSVPEQKPVENKVTEPSLSPEKVEKTQEVAATPVEQPKTEVKTVNTRALYKGNKASTGTGSGDGTTDNAGNQGSVSGTAMSSSYSGTGSGSGNANSAGSGKGVALDLAGRVFVTRPKVTDNEQNNGKIIIDIVVNREGKVISAKVGRGTTISNTKLWAKCEEAVLSCELNSITYGPDTQSGKIVFSFILE